MWHKKSTNIKYKLYFYIIYKIFEIDILRVFKTTFGKIPNKIVGINKLINK